MADLFSVDINLAWTGPFDWDLHLETPAAHIYFGNLSADGFTLNHDAHPDCATEPLPPETITGTGTAYGEYNAYKVLYSECNGPSVSDFTGTLTVLLAAGIYIDDVFHPQGSTFVIPDGTPFVVSEGSSGSDSSSYSSSGSSSGSSKSSGGLPESMRFSRSAWG